MKKLLKIGWQYWFIATGFLLITMAAGAGIYLAMAAANNRQFDQASPLHPTFSFLDIEGVNVLESGGPVSTMKTCGQCHDTDYIENHSYHADLGLSDIISNKPVEGEPWDVSNGIFGHWNPLTYRFLSQEGDQLLDLGTPEWLMQFGERVVGGGPAMFSRSGIPLTATLSLASDPETSLLDQTTAVPRAWDWKDSGTLEMNCFLCHLPDPNNDARTTELRLGRFAWANTATLEGTEIVKKNKDGEFIWNKGAFDLDGKLNQKYTTIQDPTNANCSQCHGLVHTDSRFPLILTSCELNNPQTATTGQVVASQKISESGVNLLKKDSTSRSWDIHAERQLLCTDCHYSLNNPIYYQGNIETRPAHLTFDPRRLDLGEYLKYPNHNFARGQSAQFNIAPELKGTMRRCETCHDALKAHNDWLPYTERHMAVVACETCHIPQMYAPAIQSYDWTVLSDADRPASTCRGVENNGNSINDLVTGFQPVLLMRRNVDGNYLLAPYNLITSWYWVYEDAQGNIRPVRLIDLASVYYEKESYASEILEVFDFDGNDSLSSTELRIDSRAKQEIVAQRLVSLGLKNPRIIGQVQPYSINHNVTGGSWATSDCRACHHRDSRISQPMQLAAYLPGGIVPEFIVDSNVSNDGSIYTTGGGLYYQPDTQNEKLYVFGLSRVAWVDWVGGLFFFGILVAVSGHGGLRFIRSLHRRKERLRVRKIYMYHSYERFWHWLQTLLIVFLLLTGLVIHRPDLFGAFSFRGQVIVHNVLAAILALNAALSLFYHLTTGQIRQFLPRPYGFFEDAIEQARYYIRGIFKREAHPFEKTPEKKMNPLQQVTYLGILNVLLPLQGITGILMWGVQRWPQMSKAMGGLPFLAPFHTLIAWIFAAFIVGHVYLTTTGGVQPLTSIKAMVTGWEEVEVHSRSKAKSKKEEK